MPNRNEMCDGFNCKESKGVLISEEKGQHCNLSHYHMTQRAVFRIPSRKETEPLRAYS